MKNTKSNNRNDDCCSRHGLGSTDNTSGKAKDIAEKYLEDYTDVFADIINVIVFNGERVVKPDELACLNGHSQYKADDGELHETERDTVKHWKRGRVCFATFGIENQTRYDADMPMRVLAYDGGSYRAQLLDSEQQKKRKRKQRYPVVTLVLNCRRKSRGFCRNAAKGKCLLSGII